VVQKSKIYFGIIKRQNILKQPRNGHKTYFHTRKKYKRHFENIRHLGKFSLAIFFWYILSLCTTKLPFSDLKKVEFRVETTPLKKVDFFSKMTSSPKNPPFWIFEKNNLYKLENKKTLRMRSSFLKSVEN
jgi:hypothetical protein